MAWTIEYSADARKTLAKLDRPDSRHILDYLDEVAALDDPRTRGHGLTGNLAGLWRYRVGDWRVVCIINDRQLIIVAIDIGHRSTIYRRS